METFIYTSEILDFLIPKHVNELCVYVSPSAI
jgi:hypothetical protein